MLRRIEPSFPHQILPGPRDLIVKLAASRFERLVKELIGELEILGNACRRFPWTPRVTEIAQGIQQGAEPADELGLGFLGHQGRYARKL